MQIAVGFGILIKVQSFPSYYEFLSDHRIDSLVDEREFQEGFRKNQSQMRTQLRVLSKSRIYSLSWETFGTYTCNSKLSDIRTANERTVS